MRLTQIEINGFKSFARKQELSFSEGITAIVGPNGCGKSNIADAFRFVLGEQSAKALRGKRVEDFIFGGTQKRRSLSYCEVSLRFDNSDGKLITPFSDVCITRRAFRSGESEYLINSSACRLKDIHELFRDTGIGKDGYSIIGQGRVSEIISEKSADRRSAFEEAAGVMKYRARKEEAERKLLNTQKNIVRLDDISVELEERIEPLRIQSEKAINYFKLREELRDIELNLFIYQYEKSNERITQLDSSCKQLSGELELAQLTVDTLTASLSEGEDIERGISSAISDISQRLIAATAGLESHFGEEKVLRERITSLEKERERLFTDIETANDRIKFCALSKDSAQSMLDGLRNESGEVDALLASSELALSEIAVAVEQKEAELENHKQSMMEVLNRLSDAKSRVSRLDEMRSSLQKRIAAIENELQETADEGKRLADEERDCLAESEGIALKRQNFSRQLNEAAERLNEINYNISLATKRERGLGNELESAKSRRKVLAEMQRAHDGYYSSVRDLLRDAERDTALGAKIEGVVAELVTVPAEFEAAVEMALGSALQNVIVPNEQDAKQVIEYLREKKYGRATMLPVSAMRSRLLSNDERSCIQVAGCYGVASDLVEFSPRYRGVVENLLGRTVIVRDLDVGIAINKRARSAFRIATIKGDIMNPGGSMTGGSSQKREFSLLGRRRELDELDKQVVVLSSKIKAAGMELAALNTELSSANAAIATITENLRQLDIQRATQNEKHDIIMKYLSKNKVQSQRLESELSQINDNIADIDEQCREAAAVESGLSTGNASTNEDIKQVQGALNKLRAKYQTVSEEVTSYKVRSMGIRKERNAVENDISRIAKEISALKSNIEYYGKQRNDAELECGLILAKLADMQAAISDERRGVDALTDEMRRLEEERALRLKSVDELREQREAIAIELNEQKERLHKYELNLNRLQPELEALCARIWQDYELTYENAMPYRRQIAVNASHLRVDELRKAIRELGEVNTSSVEDYRNVTERYAQLKAQCDDLKQAELDLAEIIKKLTTTMEREFAEQFKLIQANFSNTFTELFRGGKAELVLSDSNDLLNCDIDIIAQPPGKKLQLLSLLSGGEQALTAIALLFAILKLKPSAFCILDEIDTSLDEANVDNFAEYLRVYSADTQFIIITHRKGSMAVCNTLYGVSMEEKGVSTLVSARFDNTQEDIA